MSSPALYSVFSLPNSSNPCPNAIWFFYYRHSGLFSKTGPKITCTRVWERVWCYDTRPGTRLGRGEVFFAILAAGTRVGTRLVIWDASGHACGLRKRVQGRLWAGGAFFSCWTRVGTRVDLGNASWDAFDQHMRFSSVSSLFSLIFSTSFI